MASIIDRTLVTRSNLANELRALGLADGDVVCAHVAMGRLGWVCGGAQTVIEALLDAVGREGTLLMPTYSGDLSDPGEWRHPPAPADWIAAIRAEMPAYDPARTPTKNMGAAPELFRTWPGVRRSPHPQSSFAAFGGRAAEMVGTHPLDNRFGPGSPLGRLTEIGDGAGKALLLGAPYDTLSLFHLTQHLVGRTKPVSKSAPMTIDDETQWVTYDDIEYPYHWFEEGVTHLIETGIAVTGRVGEAVATLMPARAAVDAIVAWRRDNGIWG